MQSNIQHFPDVSAAISHSANLIISEAEKRGSENFIIDCQLETEDGKRYRMQFERVSDNEPPTMGMSY